MNKTHPILILLLLALSLCVFGAGFARLRMAEASASVCFVTEDGAEECMEELPEELLHKADACGGVGDAPEFVARISSCRWSAWIRGRFVLRCSIGWILPLRI